MENLIKTGLIVLALSVCPIAAMAADETPPSQPATASFNCNLAKSPVEHLICSNEMLATRDADMAAAFRAMHEGLGETERQTALQDQRRWSRERAAACNILGDEVKPEDVAAATQCLIKIYDLRIADLYQLATAQNQITQPQQPSITPQLALNAATNAQDKPALQLIRPLAEQGDANAQTTLGTSYANGQGVQQDYTEALKWYRKAADHGDAAAQNNLGVMYFRGHGVTQDYVEALKWFRKAAEQGLADAQTVLGASYAEGQGVSQDYTEAVKWYRKAADQGYGMAQINLGVMYDKGQGMPQDYTEALKWYRKAADQGFAPAQYNLGAMYGSGHGVTQDYAEAVKWYRKAAEQGLADAQLSLGWMYEKGQGVMRDYVEAVKWYHMAAEQGLAGAQNNLGMMYANGQGVQQDYVEALKWYRKAAEQGSADAQAVLGASYAEGQGVPQDYTEALKWYRKAADHGDAAAQLNLGVMYDKGQGMPQDFIEALKWYRKAAEQGDTDAQYNLGLMYAQGNGIPQDYVEAVKWFRRAAEQGNAAAQNGLGAMYDNGHGVPQDYVQAYVWLNIAAESGNVEAINSRDAIERKMTPAQLEKARRLAPEWNKLSPIEKLGVTFDDSQNPIDNALSAAKNANVIVAWVLVLLSGGYILWLLGWFPRKWISFAAIVAKFTIRHFDAIGASVAFGLSAAMLSGYTSPEPWKCLVAFIGVISPKAIMISALKEIYPKDAKNLNPQPKNKVGTPAAAIKKEKTWHQQDFIKSIAGKALGGIMGFAVGGPLGALIGIAAGHAIDSLNQKARMSRAGGIEHDGKATQEKQPKPDPEKEVLTPAVAAKKAEDQRKAQQKAEQDFAEAIKSWRAAADQGDANAQNSLGGATEDYAEALIWYRKAAAQGLAAAQYNLGHMYYEGHGVTQDSAEAMTWFNKAAQQGYARAQFILGLMYYEGHGATQNYTEAVKWFRKAADQGHMNARRRLGIMYEKGLSVPQDEVKGNKAKSVNITPNAEETANYFRHWKASAAANADCAKSESAVPIRKNAEEGKADAQFKCGLMYYTGYGVPKDYDEAQKWFRKAAEQDYANAQTILGLSHIHGDGVPQDYVEAAKWLRKAAEQGDTTAQNLLGLTNVHKYALVGFAKELLRVADNLRRASESIPPDEQYEAHKAGIDATGRQMQAALECEGIKIIQSLGQPFDPNFHNAVQEIETATCPPGTIVKVLQEGYMMHDRLLREATVITAKQASSA